MATNFSPCKGSYVLNQFPSNVMFGMNGFHVSASGAIQGHHGPLVLRKSFVFDRNRLFRHGQKSGGDLFTKFIDIFRKHICQGDILT